MDRRNCMTCRQRDHLFTAAIKERIGGDDERLATLLHKRREGGLDFLLSAGVKNVKLPTKFARGLQNVFRLGASFDIVGVNQYRNSRRFWNEFEQQTQPFRPQINCEPTHSCDVFARSTEAGDEARLDGVATEGEDDRNGGGGGFGRTCRWATPGRNDHSHPLIHQVCCQPRQAVISAIGPAEGDMRIPALNVASFAQAAPECGNVGCERPRRPAVEEADHRRHWLLRARRERPRSRAAEQRDELAPSHSITSSARAMSVRGTSRPSDLAVLRLMMSSTLVDCWTGRSAGFSPLRIRPE